MKTAIEQIEEYVAELRKNYDFSFYKFFEKVKELKDTEKQQHEQTAIHITNILMDALDNPKGGKFSGEDEFNKYWENKYGSTNKETLK